MFVVARFRGLLLVWSTIILSVIGGKKLTQNGEGMAMPTSRSLRPKIFFQIADALSAPGLKRTCLFFSCSSSALQMIVPGNVSSQDIPG